MDCMGITLWSFVPTHADDNIASSVIVQIAKTDPMATLRPNRMTLELTLVVLIQDDRGDLLVPRWLAIVRWPSPSISKIDQSSLVFCLVSIKRLRSHSKAHETFYTGSGTSSLRRETVRHGVDRYVAIVNMLPR